eukprot:2908351-Rhodomonas_salina.1
MTRRKNAESGLEELRHDHPDRARDQASDWRDRACYGFTGQRLQANHDAKYSSMLARRPWLGTTALDESC